MKELINWQQEAWNNKELNQLTRDPQNHSRKVSQDEREETWFFINGVVTDHWIAQLNAEHLAKIFQRKIHILHKPTRGLDRDLRECVRGRLGDIIDVATDLQHKLEEQVGRNRSRHVEHFVNERDLVPSLSIVPENYYHIPGNIFRQAGKYGHLLSTHYLPDFENGNYRDPYGHQSVLLQYIGGKNYGKIL